MGGEILDAAEHAGGTIGTLRPDLKAVVTTALDIRRAGASRLNLELRQEGDLVRALINGQATGEETSQGFQTILGIATMLFDRRLESTPLALVTYSESVMDDDLVDAAWQLLVNMLDTSLLRRVKTLIVLIEGSRVRYGLHCSRGISLAGRLTEEGLDFRKGWNTNRADIHNLRPPAGKLLVMFLGAGFSASSGLPLGNGLRDEALTRIVASSAPYETAAGIFLQSLRDNHRLLPYDDTSSIPAFARSLTLERVLREEIHIFGAPDSPTLKAMQERNEAAAAAPGRSVRSLRRILALSIKLAIVTVNFDTLVENDLLDKVEVFASEEDFASCASYLEDYSKNDIKVPVLKLHGTIDRLDTIVATVDEMAKGLSTEKVRSLRTLLHLNAPSRIRWIYIGYSMRDPDVTTVLGLREFGDGLEETWVSPFTIPTAQAFTNLHRDFGGRPSFWRRSITESADVFFDELEAAWRT